MTRRYVGFEQRPDVGHQVDDALARGARRRSIPLIAASVALMRTIRKSRSMNPNPNGAFEITVSSRVKASADSRSARRRIGGRSPLVVDVGCRAEPLDDHAVLVANRAAAERVPAVLAVEAPDPVVQLELRQCPRRMGPGLLRADRVVGVDEPDPIPAILGVFTAPGVGQALLVHVRVRAVGRRHPDDVRKRLGNEPEVGIGKGRLVRRRRRARHTCVTYAPTRIGFLSRPWMRAKRSRALLGCFDTSQHDLKQ